MLHPVFLKKAPPVNGASFVCVLTTLVILLAGVLLVFPVVVALLLTALTGLLVRRLVLLLTGLLLSAALLFTIVLWISHLSSPGELSPGGQRPHSELVPISRRTLAAQPPSARAVLEVDHVVLRDSLEHAVRNHTRKAL
jgi:hypothetical protein